MGRDKHIRQHIREARLTTRWVIEDVGLEWTVVLNRGRFDFGRRPAKAPEVTLTWRSAAAFFRRAEGLPTEEDNFTWDGTMKVRRFFDPLLRVFFQSLQHVLRHPFDDVGESLL